ncbi:unnamed protein product, partial [Didymodactylos carnosus]
VSDKGSNMRKAWKLLKVIHMYCIAHGIHNLLMVDCFPKLTGVPDLLNKVQTIISKLRYRQHELEEEFIRLNDQTKNDLLQEIESILHIIGIESSVIEELKLLLTQNLDKRFPITPINTCAFLLDPSQLKIDINRYLIQTNTTQTTSSSLTSSSATSSSTSPSIKRNLSVVYTGESTQNMKKQVFSTTGLILNAKRTMLAPENVGKIQMIHDNYDLLKKV